MALNTQGIVQVSFLGTSEASAPQRFKCISIMGDSNRGSTTVRSRGGVLSREGPFSEVSLWLWKEMLLKKYLTAKLSSWPLFYTKQTGQVGGSWCAQVGGDK